MITLIYPYRDRDHQRVQRSLDSLKGQSAPDFRVEFVDYGSASDAVGDLVKDYPFARYHYHPVSDQPWNKSRALNSIIKGMESGHFFVADVDMIYHPDFVATAQQLAQPEKAVYFKVGFLDGEETKKQKDFEAYTVDFESTDQATGLTLCPAEAAQAIRGFDEFFHFWGAEDTDFHVRLRNNGTPVDFYEEQILMLHQWHASYRSEEAKTVTEKLQVSGIVQLNHQHLKHHIQHQTTEVNAQGWGEIPSQQVMDALYQVMPDWQLTNEISQIEHLLYVLLTQGEGRLISVEISEDQQQKSLKFKAKKQLGKKVPRYYSMKQINDLLLLHLISFYRNYPYIYRVLDGGNRILLSLDKS